MDAGDENNIHPRRKRPAGERLALLAEKHVYGIDVAADSPRIEHAELSADTVLLFFNNVGGGLVLSDGNELRTLKVLADGNEADHVTVNILGDTIEVKSPAFESAKIVRLCYAEENYCEPNLCGGTGLPAFPFTMAVNRQ